MWAPLIGIAASLVLLWGAVGIEELRAQRYLELGARVNAWSAFSHAFDPLWSPFVLTCAAYGLVRLLQWVLRRFPGQATRVSLFLVSVQAFALSVTTSWNLHIPRRALLAVELACGLVAWLLLAPRLQHWPRLTAWGERALPLLALPIPLLASRTDSARYSEDATLVRHGAVLLAVCCVAAYCFLAERARRRVDRGLAVLSMVGLSAIAYTRFVPLASATPAKSPMNILFVGLDTVRADSVDFERPAARDRTPRLRAIASQGAVFSAAYSQSSWTLPAFASMFTGLYPREHGASDFYAKLAPRHQTLAERLREAGYQTAASVSYAFLTRAHRMDQGFDAVDKTAGDYAERVGARHVTEAALAQLAGFQPGRPFFLFAHYFDAHAPYIDHEDLSWSEGYQRPAGYENGIRPLVYQRHALTDSELGYVRACYDEEIRNIDTQAARLVHNVLQRHPNTVVVVVSDHGEEFMEHGWFGHILSVRDEVAHVALMLRVPSIKHAPTITRPVETRALFATLLDLVGVDRAAELPSLRADLVGDRPAESYVLTEVNIPEQTFRATHQSALRDQRWTYVHDHARGRTALYDRAADPAEDVDVSTQQQEALSRLRAAHDALLAGQRVVPRSPADDVEVTPAEAATLRALGYAN